MAKEKDSNFILGAVVGDIVGEKYEFDNVKTTDFTLLFPNSTFTDDSVMTLAVAKWLCEDSSHSADTLVAIMQELGVRHPHRGYGDNFMRWLYSPNPQPYNSWGNGSGMRVSPVAHVATSLEECLALAKITADVTHNHPEGVKGAQAVAAAAFLYRQGKSKQEIRTYITDTFNYNLDFTIESIRDSYYFDVSCQGSVPQAIVAFLEGNTFEEVVRLAISIGGDSDTIAAMAGSIAAAGAMPIDDALATACRERLTPDLISILDNFELLLRGEAPKAKKQAMATKAKKVAAKVEMTGAQDLYNFLFEACNILRGPVSQDNFKDYITPILYYKRISDVYDEETQDALNESNGDSDYAMLPEQHRFDIPDGCHWKDVRNRTENLGAAIVGAMRKIELANPDTLYGVLSMFSSQKWTNKGILSDAKIRDLIEHLSTRNLGNKSYPADLMGDAYEVMLKKFADDSKAKAGEFYTPRSVVNLLVRILDPKPGENVYDPACGSGGMLIEAVRHMHHDNLCCGSIFGQEKNVVNSAIAKMNLFLHGASDFNIMQGDTLRSPKILQGSEVAKFDCVIANPPFALEKWGSTEWSNDRYGRNIWGTPSDSCGDYAWIQHMVRSMAPASGRMAVVMPQGVLFRGNEEGRIREKLVKSDLIEAVVTLGDKLFYGTGLSPCFLILRRMKPAEHSARILMIDGTKILTAKRAQNVLEATDIDRLYQLYIDYQDVEDHARVVTLAEIEEKGFDLSPNKYVNYHKEAIRPYEEVKAEFLEALNNVKQCEALFRELIIN